MTDTRALIIHEDDLDGGPGANMASAGRLLDDARMRSR